MTARDQGRAAELRAERHLRLRLWRVCARNWIGGGGELDLVCVRLRTLLVVEVRHRVSTAAALRSVDRAKLDRTLAAARELLRRHRLDGYRLRIDVIGIDPAGTLVRVRDVARQAHLGA